MSRLSQGMARRRNCGGMLLALRSKISSSSTRARAAHDPPRNYLLRTSLVHKVTLLPLRTRERCTPRWQYVRGHTEFIERR